MPLDPAFALVSELSDCYTALMRQRVAHQLTPEDFHNPVFDLKQIWQAALDDGALFAEREAIRAYPPERFIGEHRQHIVGIAEPADGPVLVDEQCALSYACNLDPRVAGMMQRFRDKRDKG
jgi:hypothetical protein